MNLDQTNKKREEEERIEKDVGEEEKDVLRT